MEQESESEDDEDVDIAMEDRAFTSLPESSGTYTDLIPDGWSIHGQLDSGGLPSLADRVLVYCWDNWSYIMHSDLKIGDFPTFGHSL